MANMFSANLKGVKEGGKFLQPGIHNATFKGIIEAKYNSAEGVEESCLGQVWDVEGFGEWTAMLFNPQSNERGENGFGGENPSQVEQYMIKLLHLLQTANPTIAQEIMEGGLEINEPSLKALIKRFQGWTEKFVGQTTKIKLLPGNKNFSGFPLYPASVNSKTGQLYIVSKFIGDDLTLTTKEMTQIEKARNAQPTNMATGTSSAVNGMKNSFNAAAADEVDDLPF